MKNCKRFNFAAVLFLLFVCMSFVITGCKSIAYMNVDKPDSDLFRTLDDLLDRNSYMVLSYTSGVKIENYSYELQMESQKSYNVFSLTGSSEEINCMVVVKMNNNIAAQVYSTDERNKSRIMANGFRGNRNGNVILLSHPSRSELVDAYNKMMSGKL